jgi:hypothetical protein
MIPMSSEDLAVADEERSSNVKHFYDIGHDDPIVIHDATTNDPLGTRRSRYAITAIPITDYYQRIQRALNPVGIT